MGLLNVRLDANDARIAAELREAGVELSTIVRKALREEYAHRIARHRTTKKPSEVVEDILAELPDPSDLPVRRVDPTDRMALKRRVRARLRRRRAA
jgi:hypothetical protein